MTTQSNKQLRLAMLLDNAVAQDFRVLKEAEALQKQGYLVKIFGQIEDGKPVEGDRFGIPYICFKSQILPHPVPRIILGSIARLITRFKAKPDAPATTDLPGDIWSRTDRLKAVLLDHLHLHQYYAPFKQAVRDFKPDVIHAHDLPTAVAGRRLSKSIGCKFVYDAHEYETSRNAQLPEDVWRHRARIERKVCRDADLIITVSDGIATSLARKYDVSKPEVIYNSPYAFKAVEPTETIKSTLSLKASEVLGVYIGHYRKGRGVELFLRALRDHPDVSFAFVGTPPDGEVAGQITAFAAEQRISNRLFFVEPRPPSELIQFLKGADFSALPIENTCTSHFYCMPNKLFESAFAHLPLIVSPLESMSQFVEETRSGEIAGQETSDAYSRAIDKVLNSKQGAYYSQSDIEIMSAKYGWEKQQLKLLKAYETCLFNPKRTAN